MTAFDDELALERIEAELASELPAHMRAFAVAYAAGQPAPPPPAVLRRPTTIDLARRVRSTASTSDVVDHAGKLAARATALLRIAVPIAIEDAPAVAAARAVEPTWAHRERLVAARDAAARSRLGLGHIPLMHVLHGSATPTVVQKQAFGGAASWPPPLAGWHEPAPPIDRAFVERAWRDLAIWHGARGSCRIVWAEARPRAFVVEPGREVIVVLGAIDTPAGRFAALHELGHAIAALVVPHAIVRVVDEAAAAYVARLLEHEGAIDLAWYTPLATAARERRRAITSALDSIERGGAAPPELAAPPWGLWHDPGAQAAYSEAETIAERWWNELGATPSQDELAKAIANEDRRVDQLGTPGPHQAPV